MVSKAGFSFLPLAEMFREWIQSNQKIHDKSFAKTFTGINDSFVIGYNIEFLLETPFYFRFIIESS